MEGLDPATGLPFLDSGGLFVVEAYRYLKHNSKICPVMRYGIDELDIVLCTQSGTPCLPSQEQHHYQILYQYTKNNLHYRYATLFETEIYTKISLRTCQGVSVLNSTHILQCARAHKCIG